MISRRTLHHVSAGLLDKFIGRGNDVDGYWAFGVLCREAGASANRLELDLLAGTAQPGTPSASSVARSYAHYLRQAMARRGVAPDELDAVRMVIAFGLPPVPRNPNLVQIGDPFTCTLQLATRDGRALLRQKLAHCLPYDEFQGTRSTRYHG